MPLWSSTTWHRSVWLAPSRVKAYLERKQTRYDHQDGICEVHGVHSFTGGEGSTARAGCLIRHRPPVISA
jgi:hypothetical protein